MPAERVLICGAGIAGSVLAFWLAKHDYQVVVIERSKVDQKTGQGLEIEEPALTVVREMGILEELKANRTHETGFNLVDQQSRSHGTFEVGASSPTGELEMMRGDLTEILYKAANKSSNVTYRFETVLQNLTQTQDKVIAGLENRNSKTTTTEEFDFAIGADGVKSRTRQLIMGPPEELNCFKPVGASVAYFSIPKEDQDLPYSRLCNFPDRRVIWIRPIRRDSKEVSVYLIHLQTANTTLREANSSGDRQKQKAALAESFSGLGWEAPRVIEHMMNADNFYSDELVQVKLPTWSQHRVALLGDSTWAPTPFTGQGNQLAIIGAWVLAQEMSRHRSRAAFEKYETRLRPYVETCQQIPLGGYAPYLCCPKTIWGIWLFRTFMYLLSTMMRIYARVVPAGKSTGQPSHSPEFDLEVDGVSKSTR